MKLLRVISDVFRLLTFRSTRAEMLAFGSAHFAFGLISTWIIGVGRYWDNGNADFLQRLGVGSVVYVFALSLLLWFVVKPLCRRDWTYFHVVTFVSLVSPPAVLDAIPVQMFFDLGAANEINAAFLLVVSVWRAALLIFFLKRFAALDFRRVLVTTLLPVTLIIFALVMLNPEKAVFGVTGGFASGTPNDEAFAVLALISFFSMLAFPFLLVAYIVLVVVEFSRKRKQNFPA
jgi:phage shock protein PspC (stress-responsive transcriptional regulator)